jgi:hypothetical protein
MKQWLEEDQDELAKKEKEVKDEKAKLAKKEHEDWVKKKDSLRIRLPTQKELSIVLPKNETRMRYVSILKIITT